MKNKNELNRNRSRLPNDSTRDENYYAPLKNVNSNEDLHRLFVSMDQALAVEWRKVMAQLNNKKAQKPKKPEIWLNTTDVMSYCQISRRTVANCRKQKKLAFTKLGNKCFYRQCDVDAMMFDKYNGKKVETDPTGKEVEQ